MAIGERPDLDQFVGRVIHGVRGIVRWCAQFLVTPRGPDRVDELLNRAPLDDEPVTGADVAAIEVAKKEHERGETVPLSEFKRSGG